MNTMGWGCHRTSSEYIGTRHIRRTQWMLIFILPHRLELHVFIFGMLLLLRCSFLIQKLVFHVHVQEDGLESSGNQRTKWGIIDRAFAQALV